MNDSSLAERLAALRRWLARERPQIAQAYDRMVEHLAQSGAGAGALRAGDLMPAFGLTAADGRFVTSGELLATGPLVLSFYRGAWCSYCQTELTALRDNHDAIRALGGRVAVVSGEMGGRGIAAAREHSLPFDVLSDVDLGLALAFGLVVLVPGEVREIYEHLGYDLARINGNPSWFLPIPATYVVARDGSIASAFVEPDFRFRMDPAEILATLARLRSS
ncbi:Peroxiredoxin [Hyphomicrobiales bacterium]|nr:Peroxiredoxin [Hyphomicrobiales bacterium]CAH1699273.1 Peroxiredoxin [Hyphomicrobiales bacterium]CAI0343060.1 Peroxiredoxin [Hyphomicrobiales bacterium]